LATLALSNISQRNALTPSMMVDLAEAVDELEADSKSVGLLLRGAGATFCAGASFSIFADAAGGAGALREVGEAMREVMVDATERLGNLPLLSVALIDGHAIGGGAELATCTDFRVFAPRASMRFVQAKMGLTPGWGGAARLVELVGRRQALLLLGSGRPVSYEHAKAIGLADACAASDASADVDTAVAQFVGHFIRQPYPEVVRSMKRIVGPPSLPPRSPHERREEERSAFLSLWGGPSNLEAVAKAHDKGG
jgi:ethylmalonyl-CoA/methylmalonyl-CoA decarboxylase